MPRARVITAICVLAVASAADGEDIVVGDVTAALGPDFFFDTAQTGGSDNNTSNFNRDISGYWTAGATVTLRGLGWASSSGGTTATTATATFTDLGPDDSFGTADDVVVGSATDNLVFTGVAGEFVWDFDGDIAFTATGTSLRINIASDGNIRRKTSPSGDTTQAAVKLSLAGIAVGGEPAPATNTATASGFWDSTAWDTGSGTVNGGVNDDDTVLIGQYRTVTYRGLPSDETLSTLNLGENSANPGQGTLVIESGSLSVTGNLTAGRNDSANDSFVRVDGGMLHVGGNAVFGRSAESCDGSLIVAGGAVQVGGDLAMGGFEQGGAMLRFHDPGSSPAVQVGGTLVLGRCSLDLTFSAGYTHTPGTVIPLVTFGSREGQFLNFRRGEEFNCGPNRFRIDYSPASITLTALANWPAPAGRPNIILLFADDQGYADLQLNGGDYADKYPMPRLQQLADAGARFTDAYVTGGVCHPSRCGLLTGRYQQRFGTDNNLGDASPSHDGMAVSQRTVPRRLQGLGYRTYGIGKWHLGDTVEYHPNCRGFDRWYGLWAGSRSYWENTTETGVFQEDMTPRFEDEAAKDYVTDRIGDACVAFIDEHLASPHAAEPFFIYVSFTAVHGPVDIDTPPAGSPSNPTDPRYARLLSEFGLDASDYSADIVFSGSNAAAVAKNRHDLAAMSLALDENVGKVLDKLAAEGIANDTLVVYTNDNGGAGWSSGNGGNYSYNVPLRGYKGGSMTDGSIRVPAAAIWPGTIPAGQTITDPVISLDWGATFVNASGSAPSAARNGLDGLDLLPLLTEGAPLPADRVLCWRAAGSQGGGSAARMGDWKVLIADPGGAPKLYNLRSDIDENDDQSTAQSAMLAELLDRFRAWEARTLPPIYGSADTVLDAGLERWGIAGGLRMRTPSAATLWQSASFRDPLSLAADFDFSFMIRASEVGPHDADAALWHGLGDSTTRADFIRFGIDFGNGTLAIAEGKTGHSASTPLPALPTDFAAATLRYRAASGEMILALGETSVSLALNGSYGNLTKFAMGAAAMEGELTTLQPIAPGSTGAGTTSAVDLSGDPFAIRLDFATEPPFEPRLERSADLAGFAADEAALLESIGGGVYQVSAPGSALPREFFRFRIDQP